jgi:2-polyprenyl-3-methyl-5-hydroxy-6-metoxy-1,4-benzoquinol methylase
MELEKVKCNLCGKRDIKIIYNEKYNGKKCSDLYNIKSSHSHDTHDQIVMCKNCKLVYASPRDKEIVSKGEYTKVKSIDYISGKKEKIIDAKRIITVIKKELEEKGNRNKKKTKKKKLKMLDIGCFAAFLLTEAKKNNFEVYGIEPSKWAADYNKKVLKIENMLCGTIDNSSFRDSFFDVIVLNEVIEHLHDPNKMINFCNKKLKKNGIMVIIAPDFASIHSKLMKEKWWFIEKVHLYYFTRKTMQELLEKNNFSGIRIKRYYKSFMLDYVIKKLNLSKENKFLKKISNGKLLKELVLRLYSGEMLVIAKKNNS